MIDDSSVYCLHVYTLHITHVYACTSKSVLSRPRTVGDHFIIPRTSYVLRVRGTRVRGMRCQEWVHALATLSNEIDFSQIADTP